MANFNTAIKVLTWILVIAIGILTFLAPSLFVIRQISNWNIGSNWAIGDNWVVGSTSVSTPLSIDGVLEVLKKAVEVLSQGEVAIPMFVIGTLILSQIYKRREKLLRFN